jgi:hypothetical protein
MGEPATLEVGMTEADFSNKNLGIKGAIIISAWITHKDKGALSVANVMGNKIGKEQLSKLQEIMRSKPNLVSLCGIADDATEADLSGLGMDADDAAILASELPDKGALTKLTFGGDEYGPSYYRKKPAPATLEVGMTELDFSNKNLGVGGATIISAWITHKDNGALLSLSLASNNIGGHYDDDGDFVATPAGTYFILHSCCAYMLTLNFNRSYCHCHCNQGYEGPIRHQCHGQPHRQGAASQAPGDNALKAQSSLSLRYCRWCH